MIDGPSLFVPRRNAEPPFAIEVIDMTEDHVLVRLTGKLDRTSGQAAEHVHIWLLRDLLCGPAGTPVLRLRWPGIQPPSSGP
jgi:hypothetical protein